MNSIEESKKNCNGVDELKRAENFLINKKTSNINIQFEQSLFTNNFCSVTLLSQKVF
jgi:hypothetical protein